MELIKIQESANGNQVVLARDLHKGLGSKQDFSDWIKARLERFEKDVDFILLEYDFKGNLVTDNSLNARHHKFMESDNQQVRVHGTEPDSKGNQVTHNTLNARHTKNGESDNQQVRVHRKEYILTLDTCKSIAMLENNAKGDEVRKYFISCEKKLKESSFKLPQTFSEALRQLADSTELIEVMQIEQKVNQPKVNFFNTVVGSESTMTFEEVAKIINLGFGRNKLFELLRKENVLQSNNIPYQKFVDKGYFKLIEGGFYDAKGKFKVTYKTVVFQKGIDYIIKLIQK